MALYAIIYFVNHPENYPVDADPVIPALDDFLGNATALRQIITDPGSFISQGQEKANGSDFTFEPGKFLPVLREREVEVYRSIIGPEALAQGAQAAKRDIKGAVQEGSTALRLTSRIINDDAISIDSGLSRLQDEYHPAINAVRQLTELIEQGRPEGASSAPFLARRLANFGDTYRTANSALRQGYDNRQKGTTATRNNIVDVVSKADRTMARWQAVEKQVEFNPVAGKDEGIVEAVINRSANTVLAHQEACESEVKLVDIQTGNAMKVFQKADKKIEAVWHTVREGQEIGYNLPSTSSVLSAIDEVITSANKLLSDTAGPVRGLESALRDVTRFLNAINQNIEPLQKNNQELKKLSNGVTQAARELENSLD
jgi:hypothetical protein